MNCNPGPTNGTNQLCSILDQSLKCWMTGWDVYSPTFWQSEGTFTHCKLLGWHDIVSRAAVLMNKQWNAAKVWSGKFYRYTLVCNSYYLLTNSSVCQHCERVISCLLQCEHTIYVNCSSFPLKANPHLVLLSLQESGLVLLTGWLEGVVPLFQRQVTLLHVPRQPQHDHITSTWNPSWYFLKATWVSLVCCSSNHIKSQCDGNHFKLNQIITQVS